MEDANSLGSGESTESGSQIGLGWLVESSGVVQGLGAAAVSFLVPLGRVRETGRSFLEHHTYQELLMDAPCIRERLQELELEDWNGEQGIYELGGTRFEAQRIEGKILGVLAMHGWSFPAEAEIECHQFCEVP